MIKFIIINNAHSGDSNFGGDDFVLVVLYQTNNFHSILLKRQ